MRRPAVTSAPMPSAAKTPWLGLVLSGLSTATLYGLLFAYEAEVMSSFTRTDGLYPFLPIAAAFAFSLSHGAFTSYFWDALGVKPKPASSPPGGAR